MTLLAWVRASAVPGTVKAIAGQGTNGFCSYSSYALYTGGSADSPGLRFYITNTSQTGFVTPPADNVMWNGDWHLAAGTYDGARVRLYVDGFLASEASASGSIRYGLDVSNNFIVGNTDNPNCTDPGGNNFSGDIDDVRVYDRALTQGEISCLAAAGAAQPPVLIDGESPPSCTAAAPQPQPESPKTVLGKVILVKPVKGKVFVKVPGSHKFVRLEDLSEVPVKSIIDTRKGTVKLRSAKDSKGHTQFGYFSAGIFQVLQSSKKKAKGLTELVMKGGNRKKACATRKRKHKRAKRSTAGPTAQAARRKHKRWRRLRHRAHGRFRTRGRYSSATVRGTTWTVSDRCDGTLTAVSKGKVLVRDFRRHRNVLVKRGKKYLAKAP